ncbi:MAG: hypothetical protein Q7T20_07280, partial [Saprospiraceae bacterium]|nr:hypothetical protein [Saprospiraceae bacterium]
MLNKMKVLAIPMLLFWSFMLLNPLYSFGQCNPFGNVSRYEFDIDPTVNLNIVGQQFCTSMDGTTCCSNQNSYRCLDVIFNLSNGPNGETFSASCNGIANFLTGLGNFDALFFSVGVPDPDGSSTDCATNILVGNNYTISVEFIGNNLGEIIVELTVRDHLGNLISFSSQTAIAGQSIIFTMCKAGSGCLDNELVFGCCDISGTLDLDANAASTICEGETTDLKFTGLGGAPDYTAMFSVASLSDTSYFSEIIVDDMDGDASMDMITLSVSPTETTTYKLISIEDASGCAQPAVN